MTVLAATHFLDMLSACGNGALPARSRHSAVDPAERISRLRLETLTFGGVVTRYTFTFTRHAGFTPDDLAYLRWNAQRNAPFLAPDPKEDAK